MIHRNKIMLKSDSRTRLLYCVTTIHGSNPFESDNSRFLRVQGKVKNHQVAYFDDLIKDKTPVQST